jgi:hypothetical protein
MSSPRSLHSKPTPASPGTSQDLEAEIDSLSQLDLQELRVRWRQLLRSRPPERLSRSLLWRLLAYKLQARVHGDLDPEIARYLDRIAKEQMRELKRQQGRRTAVPAIPPVTTGRRLKEGTLLVREFGGTMHQVTAMPDGFAWNGTTYTSLSEIARLITGTRWSGPRFFGLRDDLTRSGNAGERP